MAATMDALKKIEKDDKESRGEAIKHFLNTLLPKDHLVGLFQVNRKLDEKDVDKVVSLYKKGTQEDLFSFLMSDDSAYFKLAPIILTNSKVELLQMMLGYNALEVVPKPPKPKKDASGAPGGPSF